MTEIFVTAFLCLSSAFYLYLTGKYAFGSALHPSTGFVPTLEGVAVFLLSFLLLLLQLKGYLTPAAEKIHWKKLLFLLIGFLFYAVVLKLFGYFFTTFFFLFYLFKITDTSGWRSPFYFAIGTSLAFFLIFQSILGIALP